MKKLSNWKRTAAALGMSAMLFTGTFATAWASPSAGISVNDNINVRDSANGNVVGKLTKDQQVSIQQETQASDGNTWYEIQFTYNGTQMSGWVRSDLINTDAQNTNTSDSENSDSAEGDFYNGGIAYNLSKTMPEELIPADFTQTTITYDGDSVQAAKFEKADVTLVCLERASDPSDQHLFVYDKERDSVAPFSKIENGDRYVIVTDIPMSVAEKVTSDYQETKCELGNGTVMAYQNKSGSSDLYYVYGVSNEGKSGWYEYDAKDSTIQSAQVSPADTSDKTANKTTVQDNSSGSSDTKDSAETSGIKNSILDKLSALSGFAGKSSTTKMIFAGGGVIFLLLIILVIVFAVRYRRLKNEAVEDDDEDILEEFAEESKADPKNAAAKKSRKYDNEPEKTSDSQREEKEKHKRKKKAELPDGLDKKSREKNEQRSDNRNKKARQTDYLEDQPAKTAHTAASDEDEDFERPILPSPDSYEKKGENGMWEVQLPNETVDLMDLDEDLPELEDIRAYIDPADDPDHTASVGETSDIPYVQEEEPDFYDEEDEAEEKLFEDFTELPKEESSAEDFRELDPEDIEDSKDTRDSNESDKAEENIDQLEVRPETKPTQTSEWADDDIEFLD